MRVLEYGGYLGSIEINAKEDYMHGKVLGIKHLLMYEGKTAKELFDNFKEAIQSYFYDCKEEGIIPEKPFKGSFNVRISPDLHRKAVTKSYINNQSLNAFVSEAINKAL